MSILIDRNTPVIVQGITGRIAGFHTEEMIAYGTNVSAGWCPGKGGTEVQGVPVFDTAKDAVSATGATASIVIVPPPFAADSIQEAADASISLCVAITDGIAAQDMMQVKRFMRRYRQDRKMRLIGPNCAGVISPGKALMGIMPGHIYQPGHVGIVGRSGTLGYEAAAQMNELGDRRLNERGHRRRPDQWQLVPRHIPAVRGRPRHARRDDDRRDRRAAGSRRRALHL